MHRIEHRGTRGASGWQTLVLSLALGVGIGASGIAADVRAEDTPPAPAEADDDGWQPSLGMGFLLHRQEQTGAVEGGLGSTLGGPGNTDAAVSPGFRFDADLMSPPLLDIELATSGCTSP